MSDMEENPSIFTDERLKSSEEEVKEYKDKYLRLLAEIDNTRKRMQKEKQEMTRFAIENALADLLGPIDNMENALKFTENMSGEVRNWALGFEMILGQFKDVLNNHDIVAFDSKSMPFDPKWHHAIEAEETTSIPEGTIVHEFVKGYKSGERTIRPAQVKVAIAPEKKNNAGSSGDTASSPAISEE
ncbi:MAG TPA: nucleotide exchange factor GrpE [Rhabdochlamydiaceae bacterium]|jgi:molecular chaperone GrpE